MFNQIRANLASFIHPGVSIPGNGTEQAREVRLISAPAAPIAGTGFDPNALAYTANAKAIGNFAAIMGIADLGEAARLFFQAAKAQREQRGVHKPGIRPAAALPGRPAARAVTPPPALDDNGVAQPVQSDKDATLDSVLKMLQDALADLKELASDTTDSDDEKQAKAAIRAGNKPEALRRFDSAISALGARINAKNMLRNQPPDGNRRAHALISTGFNEQPAVAALNLSLGRGHSLSLTDRASLALAPIGAINPLARRAAVAESNSPPDVVKIRSIKAQLAEIDKLQRREFSNERNARHGELTRQLSAEMKKFHVQ